MLDFFYVRYEKMQAGWFDSLAVTYSLNTQREERVNQGGNGNPKGSITHQKERTWANGVQAQASRQWGSATASPSEANFITISCMRPRTRTTRYPEP